MKYRKSETSDDAYTRELNGHVFAGAEVDSSRLGLNAALTYPRAKRIQRAALEDCPFTHSTGIGQGLFGLTNHKNDSRAGT